MTLTPNEKAERDPAALQRELLELNEAAREIADKLTEATGKYHDALREVKVLQAQKDYIKQSMMAIQSVLKSLSSF